jgi:hypothetical protein
MTETDFPEISVIKTNEKAYVASHRARKANTEHTPFGTDLQGIERERDRRRHRDRDRGREREREREKER